MNAVTALRNTCRCSVVVLMASVSSSLTCEMVSVLWILRSQEKISCHPQGVVTLPALSEQTCLSFWVPPARQQIWNQGNTPQSHFFLNTDNSFSWKKLTENLYFLTVLWNSLFSKILTIDFFPADENVCNVECDQICSNLHESNNNVQLSAMTVLYISAQ